MKRLTLILGLILALARPCLAEEPGIAGEYRNGDYRALTRTIALAENSDKFLLLLFTPPHDLKLHAGTWSFDGRKTLILRYRGVTETFALEEFPLPKGNGPQGWSLGLRRVGEAPADSLLTGDVFWKQPESKFLRPAGR